MKINQGILIMGISVLLIVFGFEFLGVFGFVFSMWRFDKFVEVYKK